MTVEAVWFSESSWARIARGVLAPFALLFRCVVALRNWLYDIHVLPTVTSPIPAISIGNVSVGGTGKTPISAYIVQRLRALGHHPAIVMRGYGKDETEVHALLNPDTPVYANPDRSVGIAQAAKDGADVVVLDDAFQHRCAGRDLDIVLVSAEQWRDGALTLPAGPLREPWPALRRATLIGITYRVATMDRVQHVATAIARFAPAIPVALLHLEIGTLHSVTDPDTSVALNQLSGERVLAIAGIGDARSFFGQLENTGARLDERRFADHHPYSAADVAAILGGFDGHKYIIATLKDAVKLRGLWPPKAPALWYVSQAVEVTGGLSAIDSALTTVCSTVRLETTPAEI